MSSSGSAEPGGVGLSSPSSASASPAPIGQQNQSRFSRLFTPQRSTSDADLSLASTPPKPSGVEAASSGLAGADWLATGGGGLSGLSLSDGADDDLTATLTANDQLAKDGFSFLDDPAGDDFFLRSRPERERNPSSAVSPKPTTITDFFGATPAALGTSPTQTWSTGFIGAGSPGIDRGLGRERERSESWTGVGAEWGSAPAPNSSWSAAVGSSSASSSPVSSRSFPKPDSTSSAIPFTTPPLLSSPAFATSAFSSLPNASLLPRLTATVEPFVPKPLPAQAMPLPPPVQRDQPRVPSPVNTFQSAALGPGPQQQQLGGGDLYARAPGSLSASGPARAGMGMTRPVQGSNGLMQQPPHMAQGRMSYPPAGPQQKQPGFTSSGQPTAPAPPPPEPSVRTWPIVKVENIPFNTTVFDIEQWLPPLSLPNVGNVIQPVHIVLHRTTGRTLPHCYLEMVSIEAATNVIALKDRTALGDRTVRAKWERSGELLRDLFSQEGYFSVPYKSPAAAPLPPAPVKWQLPKTLLTPDDLSQLLFYCCNPVHAKERPLERPFLNLVSIIAKFPWNRPDKFTDLQQQQLFDTAFQAIAVAARGSRDDPGYTPLMEKLTLIMLACPGFTEAQKDKVRNTTFAQFLEVPIPAVASPARRKTVTLPAGVPGPMVGVGVGMVGGMPSMGQMGGQMGMNGGGGMMGMHQGGPPMGMGQQPQRGGPMQGMVAPQGHVNGQRPHSIDFAGSMRPAVGPKRQSGYGLDGTPNWLAGAIDGPHTPPPTPPDARDPIASQHQHWQGQQQQQHQFPQHQPHAYANGHGHSQQQQQQYGPGVGANGGSRLGREQVVAQGQGQVQDWGVQGISPQASGQVGGARFGWN